MLRDILEEKNKWKKKDKVDRRRRISQQHKYRNVLENRKEKLS